MATIIEELKEMAKRKGAMRDELEKQIAKTREELQILEDALAEIIVAKPQPKATRTRGGRKPYTAEQKAAASVRMKKAWKTRNAKKLKLHKGAAKATALPLHKEAVKAVAKKRARKVAKRAAK